MHKMIRTKEQLRCSQLMLMRARLANYFNRRNGRQQPESRLVANLRLRCIVVIINYVSFCCRCCKQSRFNATVVDILAYHFVRRRRKKTTRFRIRFCLPKKFCKLVAAYAATGKI